jgi:O-antigen ligase
VVLAVGFLAAASTLLAYWASPVVVLGLFGVALGAFIILRFGIVALLVLLPLSVPFGRVALARVGPIDISPLTILVVLLAGFWLWRILFGQEKVRASLMQVPISIFLLWGAASIFGAEDKITAVKVFFIFVMGVAVYMVISQTVRSPSEVRWIIWAIAITVAAMGAYALATLGGESHFGIPVYKGEGQEEVDFWTEGGEVVRRAAGIFHHPNSLGAFLAFTLPPAVALTKSETSLWGRLLVYLLVAAGMAGLVLTYSRGAWVGVAAALLFLTLVRGSTWLFPVLTLMAIFMSSATLLERLQSVMNPSTDAAFTSRFEFQGVALRLVEEHPLFGVGLSNFEVAYAQLLVPDLPRLPAAPYAIPPNAHNMFLQLAVDVGLVGAAAFACIIVMAFVRVFQITRRVADRQTRILSLGLAAGVVATIVQGILDTVVYQGFNVLILFTYLGLLDAVWRFDER